MSGVKVGSMDRFANVTILNTDGTAKTDVTHATVGLLIKYQRDNGSIVTLSPAAMSAGGVHVDGGIYHVGDGAYKIGLPDAAFSSTGQLSVWTELADSKSIADAVPIVEYDPLDSNALGLANIATIEGNTGPAAIRATLGLAAANLDAQLANHLSVLNGLPAIEDIGDEITTRLTTYNVAKVTDVPTAAEIALQVDVALITSSDGTDLIAAIGDRIAQDWVAGDASPIAIVQAFLGNSTVMQLITDAAAAKVAAEANQTEVAALRLTSNKVDSALEADGSGGWQLTTLAVENAPAGDWTPAELNQLRYRLQIDGTQAAPAASAPGNLLVDVAQVSGDAAATIAKETTLNTRASQSTANALLTIANKLDAMLELDGAVHRFTINALEQAPQGGGGGGTVDEHALAAFLASMLSEVPVNLLSVYSPSKKRLEIVRKSDYRDSGASQAIKIEINHPGIVVDDVVYFGARCKRESIQATGAVIDDGGQLKARFELSSKDLDVSASEHWKYSLMHVKSDVETTLAASAPMVLIDNQVVLPS